MFQSFKRSNRLRREKILHSVYCGSLNPEALELLELLERLEPLEPLERLAPLDRLELLEQSSELT